MPLQFLVVAVLDKQAADPLQLLSVGEFARLRGASARFLRFEHKHSSIMTH